MNPTYHEIDVSIVPSSVMNFSLPTGRGFTRNHVACVQVMSIDESVHPTVYFCRRLNNGHCVLAYREDLTPIER